MIAQNPPFNELSAEILAAELLLAEHPHPGSVCAPHLRRVFILLLELEGCASQEAAAEQLSAKIGRKKAAPLLEKMKLLLTCSDPQMLSISDLHHLAQFATRAVRLGTAGATLRAEVVRAIRVGCGLIAIAMAITYFWIALQRNEFNPRNWSYQEYAGLRFVFLRQDWGPLGLGKSVSGKSLMVAGQTYEKGFGTHAVSRLRLLIPSGAERLSGLVGVDDGSNRIGTVNPIGHLAKRSCREAPNR